MQNIIEKVQSGDITNNQLLQELTTFANNSADEFNEVFDALEERNGTVEEQSHILEKQHLAIQKQDSDKKIFQANEESLKKQSVAFQLECNSLKHQISVMKKEAKASKEQVARNKAAIKQRDAKIKKLEKRKPDATEMTELNTIYCKGEDVLLIYPTQLLLGINGTKRKQVVLLYTNRKGCFVTCFLDEDNEVSFSSFTNEDAPISDRTKALINKNTLQVSQEAANYAKAWLYRINVQQNMNIKPIDLTCMK